MIELLIVIAIIAILASLLLPALNRARTLAYRTDCASKERQIGVMIRMYADSFNEQIPLALDNSAGKNISGYCWIDKLQYFNKLPSSSKSAGRNLFICKKVDPERASLLYYWAYNMCLSGTLNADGTGEKSFPLRSLRKPSSTCIMLDGRSGYGTFNTFDRLKPYYAYRSAEYRHEDGTNLLYMDGHVSYEKPNPVTGMSTKQVAGTNYQMYE